MRTLAVAEVADILGISCDTVRRLADGGELPCHRLPSGYRRFDAGDVLTFRAELRRQGKMKGELLA